MVASACSLVAWASGTSISSGISTYTGAVVCGIFNGLFWIGGSLAAVVLVYSGIKYITSMDDPGERKQAKDLIKHVVIVIILLLIATALVGVATNFELESCAIMQR